MALIFQLQHLDKPTICFWKVKQKHISWFFSWFHPFISWSLALTQRQIAFSCFAFASFFNKTSRLLQIAIYMKSTTRKLIVVIPAVSILCSCFTCLGRRIWRISVNQKWVEGKWNSGKEMCVSSWNQPVFWNSQYKAIFACKICKQMGVTALFEDFGGFFLSGGHPFVCGLHTDTDKQ